MRAGFGSHETFLIRSIQKQRAEGEDVGKAEQTTAAGGGNRSMRREEIRRISAGEA